MEASSPWRRALRLEGKRGFALALLLYLALLALLFPEAIFQGKVFQTPDSLAPGGLAVWAKSQGLDSPLWNPLIFAGMPAFASLSYHPGLYPVNLFLRFLIDHAGFPPLTWLLFHYLWASLGIFAYLRWKGSYGWTAWMAGALFLLLPSQVAVGVYGHGSKVMSYSWIPWILLFTDRVTGGRRILLDLALLALSVTGLLLSAHVQVVYYGLLTAGLYAFFRLLRLLMKKQSKAALLRLGAGLLALLLAMGASAILYGPVHEYSAHSIRGVSQGGGADWDYATAWSLHPVEWSTFLFPSSVGFGEETYFGHMPMTNYPNYLGLLPFLVLILNFWRRKPCHLELFFAGLFLMATLVAAGRHFPLLYRPFYDFLPWFNRFRVPVMILLLQQLSLAILFARGLDRVLRNPGEGKKLLRIVLIAFLLSLLLLVFLPVEEVAEEGLARRLAPRLSSLTPSQARGFVAGLAGKAADWFRMDSARSVLLLTPFILLLWKRHHRVFRWGFPAAVLLILLLDFLPLDYRILHPEKHWDSHKGRGLWAEPASPEMRLPSGDLHFLSGNLGDERFYALSGSGFEGNEAAARGLASLGGYHAAKLALADSVIRALPRGGAPLLGRFSVKYLIAGRSLNAGPDFPPVRNAPPGIYENRHWRPRLFLEDRVILKSPEESRALLLKGMAPKAGIFLSAGSALELHPSGEACGRILEASYGLDEVSCEVEMQDPGLLVLADMNYPGWSVEVNGNEAELLSADGFFRSVYLSEGSHRIRFFYELPNWNLLRASWFSSFGLMGLLMIAGLLTPKLRRERS
ncbi:MAG: hypothetical protein QGG80_04710 [Candidatus Krumholzibacteria bacterium]|jgi:hypothetical protein|nr:hypothetical protein [Candidatus Krumholzibacteria bacterium]MDP6796670.1 hypothetical protein [Candidatus Krumholzibacteria bacterium]MDP7021639.1 hypothetical protein [Candidatus Krumholzibacteria bacterium]